jgi:hypothetical protein
LYSLQSHLIIAARLLMCCWILLKRCAQQQQQQQQMGPIKLYNPEKKKASQPFFFSLENELLRLIRYYNMKDCWKPTSNNNGIITTARPFLNIFFKQTTNGQQQHIFA